MHLFERDAPLVLPRTALTGRRSEGRINEQSRGVRSIAMNIPEGWKVKVAGAWSPMHVDFLWTVWLDESVMGWSGWHSSVDPWELKDWARAYVDECMASCVPDQGNGIPTPSRCDVTQGGDKCSDPWCTTGDGCGKGCRDGEELPSPKGGDRPSKCIGCTPALCEWPACRHTPPDCDAMGCPYCGAARGQPHVGCILR